MEKTLVILKPDTVRRKLVGEIIKRIESKNYTILHMKTMKITREMAEEHYRHVRQESIYEDMIEYVCSDTVVALIIEGRGAIQVIRNMIGKTSSVESPPGTIRGDFGSHRFENLVHASDSDESFKIEKKRFFPELDL